MHICTTCSTELNNSYDAHLCVAKNPAPATADYYINKIADAFELTVADVATNEQLLNIACLAAQRDQLKVPAIERKLIACVAVVANSTHRTMLEVLVKV